MALPTIASFPPIPDRATAGSDYSTTLATWIDNMNSATTSYNAYMAAVQASVPDAIGVPRACQCYLNLSGNNLLLGRRDGKHIVIDDKLQIIPAAGISLAPTGVATTLYYIYAAMVSGVMTLEASTTGYAADSRNGIKVKSDDATRTLVGMARTNASGTWVDTAAQRFVLSWFNRALKLCSVTDTTVLSTSAATLTWVSSVLGEFLSWGGTGFIGMAVDQKSDPTHVHAGVGCNTTTLFTISKYFYGNGGFIPGSVPLATVGVNPGYNVLAMLAQSSNNITTYLIGFNVFAFIWG